MLLGACRKERSKITMTESELVNLLIDVHVAEAAVQDLYGETKDSVGRVYYEQIYQIHGIDQIVFDTTLAVLRRNPEYAGSVYQKVMQEIDRRQAEQ
jgi:hypothetical protein